LNVLGQQRVVILGNKLPLGLKSFKIGSQNVNVVWSNETMIVFNSPSMSPGLYDLIIPTNDLGLVKYNIKYNFKFFGNNFIKFLIKFIKEWILKYIISYIFQISVQRLDQLEEIQS
jgi:hypothetical protein